MTEPHMSSVPPPPPPPAPDADPTPGCYRHPGQKAGVTCQRCSRPICWRCMHQASVGFHCPECAHEGARQAPVHTSRTIRTAPGERTPYVTYTLIALNVVAFVAMAATTVDASSIMRGASGSVYQNGVLYGPAVGAGEWWRLVTSGFLHAGLLHIGMNMLVLYMIGPQLEGLLGRWRYLALYVAALFAGALGVMLVSPQTPTLGASGAIYGLLGAAAAFQVSRRISLMSSGLGSLIAINLVITFAFSSSISVGGHVGGLIGGAACGWLMFQLEDRDQPGWLGVLLGVALSSAFVAAAIALAPTATMLR